MFTHVYDKFSQLTESMSKRFSNLWEKQMWRWSTRSCSTKTWNVIRFNPIKGAGLVVDALFRAACSLECNLIQINKTDQVYPLGLAVSPSDPSTIPKMQQLVSRPNFLPKLLFCFHSVISF